MSHVFVTDNLLSTRAFQGTASDLFDPLDLCKGNKDSPSCNSAHAHHALFVVAVYSDHSGALVYHRGMLPEDTHRFVNVASQLIREFFQEMTAVQKCRPCLIWCVVETIVKARSETGQAICDTFWPTG